ncbi:hypothetical protein Deide_1p00385 (plasmid) [Deinococcus deserti VCD115]|uniref:Uncharacterized protein n=1 Tax=Deinococcus deserti (strain DSM 17065 / CIP 109153 / LMG 22923 / VCD115) TaxID=546414 RepID=X5GY60_DEIDV|nr:hypothetical protein Deide_1p00385 [Deinococcus deserti VCD115]
MSALDYSLTLWELESEHGENSTYYRMHQDIVEVTTWETLVKLWRAVGFRIKTAYSWTASHLHIGQSHI